jgi:MFS family permease
VGFPKRDRAFATGIFNAGTNVASMVGPPLFAWMLYDMGLDWRMCFLVTGSAGFLWLVVWLVMHREPKEHPGVNAAELAYIHSDPEEATQKSITWGEALRYRETWGFALGKFLTDPVWWFYLYWLPPYLYDVRKFDLKQIGWALPVVYLVADFGSVAGGWLAGYWIRKGMGPGQGAQGGDAGVRGDDADCIHGRFGGECDSGGGADQPGDIGASGAFGESVHYGVGRISETGGGFSDRDWRVCGRFWGRAVFGGDSGVHSAALRLHAGDSDDGDVPSDGSLLRAQDHGPAEADSD